LRRGLGFGGSPNPVRGLPRSPCWGCSVVEFCGSA
jgi:hypothetical protein